MKELEQYSNYIIALRKQGLSFQEISRQLREEKNIDIDRSTIAKYCKKIEHKIELTSTPDMPYPVNLDTDNVKPIEHKQSEANISSPGFPIQIVEDKTVRDTDRTEYRYISPPQSFLLSDITRVVLVLIGITLLVLWGYGKLYPILFFFIHLFRSIDPGNESALIRIFSFH